MTSGNDPWIARREVSPAFSSLLAEHRASAQIYPEMLARLAMSLAADVIVLPGEQSPSLIERANAAGIDAIGLPNLAALLSDKERACLPAAQTMIDVCAKGWKG